MAFTEKQIAKIRQKADQLPDALKRDPNVNYYEGWFFVTLNTREDVQVLSTCEGNASIPDGKDGAPRCVYSEVGKGVLAAWHKMADVCKTVELDMCEAMPEHFHGLVHLLPGNRRHLGSLISGFLGGCTHAYWDTLGIEWRQQRDARIYAHKNMNRSAYAQLPPDRDKDHTHSYRGPALFVRGYCDTEPITAEQVEVKRAYIRDQARKRLIQGDCHDCFGKRRNQHSRNWTMERIQRAIGADRFFGRNAEMAAGALANVQQRLNWDGKGLCLDYLGARKIMEAKRKLPLVCHRADAPQFERQKEAVLRAAREGAVVVSAFISPKEREIKTELMVELLPFIEITDNGYAERYKPVGKAFYAVAENRLVQITPWTYQYQKDGAQVTREMCLVMNELARCISGVDDVWWKEEKYQKELKES